MLTRERIIELAKDTMGLKLKDLGNGLAVFECIGTMHIPAAEVAAFVAELLSEAAVRAWESGECGRDGCQLLHAHFHASEG